MTEQATNESATIYQFSKFSAGTIKPGLGRVYVCKEHDTVRVTFEEKEGELLPKITNEGVPYASLSNAYKAARKEPIDEKLEKEINPKFKPRK